MSLMCAYQDCLCVKYPCSSIAFFRLPSDDRRTTWIKNSGNKSLIHISAKAHRFFCENHFQQCDIRTQFNRKILRKHAVPIKHDSIGVTLSSELKQDSQYTRPSDEAEDGKQNEETHLVIEKLEEGFNTTQFYEEGEMSVCENQGSNHTAEDFGESYTFLDLYIPNEQCELQEQREEQTPKGNKLQDERVESYFEETRDNQVDSSTMDLQSDADVGKSLDELNVEPQVAIKKRKPNEVEARERLSVENVQVTTSNNDYQEDKHFALSLVGYFQRLPKTKKAMAKLKILQYLTELEIGSTANL